MGDRLLLRRLRKYGETPGLEEAAAGATAASASGAPRKRTSGAVWRHVDLLTSIFGQPITCKSAEEESDAEEEGSSCGEMDDDSLWDCGPPSVSAVGAGAGACGLPAEPPPQRWSRLRPELSSQLTGLFADFRTERVGVTGALGAAEAADIAVAGASRSLARSLGSMGLRSDGDLVRPPRPRRERCCCSQLRSVPWLVASNKQR